MGYLVGFIFYWGFWCVLFSAFLLKWEGIISLFREEQPLFQISNWLPAALLIVIVAVTIIMYPPMRLLATPVELMLVALIVAIINGICEEILWRGVYVKIFPGNWLLGVLYPSIGFALWHISPGLVFPAETGIGPFVLSTFFLGISYGWISFRTGSIKWAAISHSLGGILALGGSIAPAVIVLFY